MSKLQIAVPAEESRALLQSAGALKSGHFLLSSGLHSDAYFQCASLLENAQTGEKVARALAQVCRDWQINVVLSPAMGAVLIGYELSRELGVRNIFAERPEGKFELRRGFVLKPGERVLLAENVVTTGGSVLETAELVRSHGAEVAGFAVIVDRSGGLFAPLEPVVAYATLEALTYKPENCPLCKENQPLIKPGSRGGLEKNLLQG